MPKQRITKEMVLAAAFGILREEGEDNILVKNIAAKLSCSVQPIYSYCDNMDALRQELSEMAAHVMREYVGKRLDQNNLFESTGKAYSSFAKENPHLFKTCFLRKRSNINSFEDLYAAEAGEGIAACLANTLGISESSAKNLHMNMIIYNTGLSFMLTAGCNFSEQEINDKLRGAYHAFLEIAQKEGEI